MQKSNVLNIQAREQRQPASERESGKQERDDRESLPLIEYREIPIDEVIVLGR